MWVKEVREIMKQQAMQQDEPCVDFTTGDDTKQWPRMCICKQKLVNSELFDPYKQFCKRGAHMPLMVFIGDIGKERRTVEGRFMRAWEADERGWTADRRTPWFFDGTKGKASHRKGKKAPKGKGDTTRGGGGKGHKNAGWTQIAGPRDPNA